MFGLLLYVRLLPLYAGPCEYVAGCLLASSAWAQLPILLCPGPPFLLLAQLMPPPARQLVMNTTLQAVQRLHPKGLLCFHFHSTAARLEFTPERVHVGARGVAGAVLLLRPAAAHLALFLSLLNSRRTCALRFIFCTAAL